MSYDFDDWTPKFRAWYRANQRGRAAYDPQGVLRFAGPPKRRKRTRSYRKKDLASWLAIFEDFPKHTIPSGKKIRT